MLFCTDIKHLTMYYKRPLLCFTNALFRQHTKRTIASLSPVQWPSIRLASTAVGRIFLSRHRQPLPRSSLVLRMKSDDKRRKADNKELPIEIKRTAEEIEEMKENAVLEEEVKQWLKDVVVGLNLCPFAERPMREKKLRIFTVRGNDDEKLLSSIMVVLMLQESTPGTSIVICPECYPDDFEAYLDVLNMIDQGLLVDNDMVGTLQVAPFHPLFRFEGSDADSVDNWTNRSPYPMFHILREDEVERAADSLDGDASRVWKRNVGLLEALEDALGADGIKRIFTSKATREERARVEEILKEHRLVMKPKKKSEED